MVYRRIMLVRPEGRCGWGYMWSPLAINLEYVAASIEEYVDDIAIINQEYDTDTDIRVHIERFKPDLFGVTMSATEHRSGLELCRIAKEYGLTTMVGGYHPTPIPDELMGHDQVDMVFRGESEITMKEFVLQGTPDDIEGISYRKDGKIIHNPDRDPVADLDSLPTPARHYRVGNECHQWTERGGRHRDQVHTSRGCWGKCTFCCEPSMSHSKQRHRDPEKVFQEIKEVYELHGREPLVIIFGDPHLMGRPKNIERLSELLIEANMDVIFTAMLRADVVAKNPDIIAKMVKAGIVGYCMGIESPDESELDGTKKGIDNKKQEEAVRLLRKHHAVAGGTFVIGLPGQTEEEIMTFPEYARHLGMTEAAFAVATPQAGTEFHAELDDAGMIHDDDWTNYDQMHSVFHQGNISKERIEELLTHCLGRFYAPDLFLDIIIDTQYRQSEGKKITVADFIHHMGDRLRFVLTGGKRLRPDDGARHTDVFLSATINPWTRKRTEAIGAHNVLDLERFLQIAGSQKIQISVTQGDVHLVSYILKTTSTTVEYLDVLDTPIDDATLTIELDATLLRKRLGLGLSILKGIVKRRQLGTLLRIIKAYRKNRAYTNSKTLGPMTLPASYAEDGCRMDGWDKEKYLRIKTMNKV